MYVVVGSRREICSPTMRSFPDLVCGAERRDCLDKLDAAVLLLLFSYLLMRTMASATNDQDSNGLRAPRATSADNDRGNGNQRSSSTTPSAGGKTGRNSNYLKAGQLASSDTAKEWVLTCRCPPFKLAMLAIWRYRELSRTANHKRLTTCIAR